MYEELQQIIAPNMLSSFEYTKIEELLNTYTKQEILNAYKTVGYKPIAYITKVLSNKKTKVPDWINQEIINEPIDAEAEKEHEEFMKFIKEFRENKNDKR